MTFKNILWTKMDFETYWGTIQPDAKYDNRKEAARAEWNAHPEKHAAIMRWLQRHGPYPMRNPYFFIMDFTVRTLKTVKTEPMNWNGKALKAGVEYVSAKYNGVWGLYTREDVIAFEMEVKE